ncbi:hypothetical protein [Stygiolobus sp. RP850M]|uniref:hypothetical protein n=1 Tax=Stygiolobus sp. RP850M TaxID=3133137 RepID=UPI00307F75D3
MCYYKGNSRIPWEDSNSTGGNPTVADAVVLSYVSNNSQFSANTVSNYNNYDSLMGCTSANMCGNSDIGISVGGDTYLPSGFPIFMYEYGWTSGSSIPPKSGPGYSSGYYVGILQYNDTIGYFLTTEYTNNPNPSGYYDYYYSGSAWVETCWSIFCIPNSWHLKYYFVEDNNSNIEGYSGKYCSSNNQFCDIFAPADQQGNSYYSQYGVFWLYNWFQEENNNMNTMNIFFLMNGNIFNYSLALEQYKWNGGSAYAIPPAPPGNISTITGEPVFVQSYINAYNTAFNQPANPQEALNNYNGFTYNEVNSNFVSGTFGYYEYYASLSQSLTISYLQDEASAYNGNPYLFVSAGSGGGSGYMYLDWVIVTYGVPYVASVS